MLHARAPRSPDPLAAQARIRAGRRLVAFVDGDSTPFGPQPSIPLRNVGQTFIGALSTVPKSSLASCSSALPAAPAPRQLACPPRRPCRTRRVKGEGCGRQRTGRLDARFSRGFGPGPIRASEKGFQHAYPVRSIS